MVGFLQSLSLFAAWLPTIAFAWMVWTLDRYDREPIWMVCLSFAWGAFLATSTSLFGNTLLSWVLYHWLGPEQADLLVPPIVAPLVEEPSKALILIGLSWARRFDGGPDGFVYGAAAGLGFAATENLLYFWNAAESAQFSAWDGFLVWSGTVIARTFFSAFLHASASGMVGAGIGLGKHRSWPVRIAIGAFGFGLALVAHATWNGLLTLGSYLNEWGTALTVLDFFLLPISVLILSLVFGVLLSRERSAIERELIKEAAMGVLPLEQAQRIASLRGRLFHRISPLGVSEAHYVRTATDLALRRDQAEKVTGTRKSSLERDAERLRAELIALRAFRK